MITCTPSKARPLYISVLQEDYEALKSKLDTCQKECIRIAELYRHDRDKFDKEIDSILSTLENNSYAIQDSGSEDSLEQELYLTIDKLRARSQALERNLIDKDNYISVLYNEIAALKKEVQNLKSIPHVDNSPVIQYLIQENERLKNK